MRYFTLEEAESALPRLKKIIPAALEVKHKAQTRMDALAALEKIDEPDPVQLALERAQLEFLAQGLEEILQGIADIGALLKGLEPTLVDFPSRIDGKEIYLCWMYDEDHIEYYHALGEGVAGRKPLPNRLISH